MKNRILLANMGVLIGYLTLIICLVFMSGKINGSGWEGLMVLCLFVIGVHFLINLIIGIFTSILRKPVAVQYWLSVVLIFIMGTLFFNFGFKILMSVSH